MKTKNNRTSNKKTKKHRFVLNNKFSELKLAIDKSYSEINREKNLACYLANNDKVIFFASNLFYFILLYWKKYYPTKWKEIIGNELLEKIDENNIVNKIGFNENERDEIYKLVDSNEKKYLFRFLKDKFFKVTSSLNSLSKPDYSYYHVSVNKKLQAMFINNLKKLFLINDITWGKFSNIYNKIDDKYKKSYNFFIFDIIIYGNNSVKDLSLYKKNLTYLDFIKKSVPEDKKNKPENLKIFTECNKSSIDKINYEDFKIYDAKNVYEIDEDSPYAKIMKEYGEPYLSGPSGSTAILFIGVFNFYNYSKTHKNKILLLCLIIADYIPLWHTLPEILLSSNVEMTSQTVPSYTINKEPVDYVYKMIKPYIS